MTGSRGKLNAALILRGVEGHGRIPHAGMNRIG